MNTIDSRDRGTSSGGRARLLGALTLAAAAGLVSLAARPAPQEPGGELVEGARENLERWVDVRRTLAKEKRDWAVGREVLEDQIELMQGEIETMRARIAEARETASETDARRAEMAREHDELAATADALAEVVSGLEARTRELIAQLPDPIAEKVRPVSQRIPEDSSETKLSIGERFLSVVYVLKEVSKFNQEITLSNERRSLGGGQTAEVNAIYVGIGQGYFVSADGSAAGIGRSDGEAWVWTPANESAAAIAEAIAIVNNEKTAGYVRLPVSVR